MKTETVEARKSDLQRYGWGVSDEAQSLGTATNRWRIVMRSHAWRPPTDVYETEDTVVVRVEIAGMPEDGFTISLSGRYLSIRGFRSDTPERRAYQQMEISFGDFLSEVELPCAVSADTVSADYRQGFLRLGFAKEQPKKIHIPE